MNNKIEIIDQLNAEPRKITGIKLIGCLQVSTLNSGKPNFSCTLGENAKTWSAPFGISKIERVFTQKIDGISYDIMIVHRENQSPCLFIGQWNDGVWVD
jgi:hypothetical protein